MASRGQTRKISDAKAITLERKMVTRHYRMTWDLDRCVGCDIGPVACPKEAVIHQPGEIKNGRLLRKPSVDIDADKCVFCGICEVVCPKNAVTIQINHQHENPVLEQAAFPKLTRIVTFDPERFDWDRRKLVVDNCPTQVISVDEQAKTLVVDAQGCIGCRQCEVAAKGAFTVTQPWEGKVELRRERCVEGCLACADICPTRALHLVDRPGGEDKELGLADYFCIKCGACMQVCPVKAEYETTEIRSEAYGVAREAVAQRLTNADELPIIVERWRVKHSPVESAAWIEALKKMADDKAGTVEIDRKRALKRRDLLAALKGAGKFQ